MEMVEVCKLRFEYNAYENAKHWEVQASAKQRIKVQSQLFPSLNHLKGFFYIHNLEKIQKNSGEVLMPFSSC